MLVIVGEIIQDLVTRDWKSNMLKLEYTVNTEGTDVLDFSTGILSEIIWGE